MDPHGRPALRIVIVDADRKRAETLLQPLGTLGYALHPYFICDGKGHTRDLSHRAWDMVLFTTGKISPKRLQLLQKVNDAAPAVPVIVLCEAVGASAADVKAAYLQHGVTDVVPLQDTAHLQHVVRREIQGLARNRLLHRMRRELRECEQRYLSLLSVSPEAMAHLREDRHVFANHAYLQLFGHESFAQLEERSVYALVAPEAHAALRDGLQQAATQRAGEVGLRLTGRVPSGECFPLEVRLAFMRLEGAAGVTVRVRRGHGAPTARQSGSTRTREFRRDPVTGLYSRAALLEYLQRRLPAPGPGLLLYLEVENYQAVREATGIGVSDAVAREVALLLQRQAPPSSFVARFSDNSFVLLLDDEYTSHGDGLAARLRTSLGNRVLDLHSRSVAISTRLALLPLGSQTSNPAEVMERAHAACCPAARILADPPADASIRGEDPGDGSRARALDDIADALNENRISLQFQPIVKLHGTPLELYQVFSCLSDSHGAAITAAELSPVERSAPELLGRLDRWVLECTIGLIERHERRGRATHFLVNLSGHSIRDVATPLDIGRLLKQHHAPAPRLILGVPETSAVSEVKYAQAFTRGVRHYGCGAALERFGVGLSSFNLLEHLTVEYLKIDASLVTGLATNPTGVDTVRAIVREAHLRACKTIAEGLQDANSLGLLYQSGIDFAQGNYIQEPSELLAFDFTQVVG